MRFHQFFFARVVAALAALAGSAAYAQSDESTERSAGNALRIIDSAMPIDRQAIDFHYAGGRASAVVARGENKIFSADFSGDDASVKVMDRLKRWAVINRNKLALDDRIRASNFALTPADTPAYKNKNVKIYRYPQSYRRLPIVGPEAIISVMVSNDSDVRAVQGGLIDQRAIYAGLRDGINESSARTKVLEAWNDWADGPTAGFSASGDISIAPPSQPPSSGAPGGLQSEAPGSTGPVRTNPRDQVFVAIPAVNVMAPSVRSLTRVALPTHKTIAWSGEIVGGSLTPGDTLLGYVLVSAVDGATISVQPADAKAQATIRAREMTNDPQTTAKVNHSNQSSVEFGNTINFGPDVQGPNGDVNCGPAPAAKEYRMGDSQRLTVIDFKKTLDAPTIPAVEACLSDPKPHFGANSGNTFRAQNMFVQANEALRVMDPLKGEMISHGAAHTYSWDHHPEVPEIMHRPTLALFANYGENSEGCDGSVGIFRRHWAAEGSTWFNDLALPVWHPLTKTADNEYLLAEITVCGASFTGSLFHEIGHYYDAFSAYGVLGEGGPGYTECCLDRPNEARSMAESVANLFGLFLMERVYPDINYTLSSTPGGECDMGSLGTHMPGAVVHPSCMDDAGLIWTLNEKRPTGDNAQYGCSPTGSNAYGVHGQTQAYWSLIFGQQCSVTGGGGVSCSPAHGVMPSDYSVRWMEALLAALAMGNQHSFVSLWDNMEAFIAGNYPSDVAFLQSVRALHQLEPLPHGLDPACTCPNLNGCS